MNNSENVPVPQRIDQKQQTVNGPQTNIAGDADAVYSGSFSGPIHTGTGDQINYIGIPHRPIYSNLPPNRYPIGREKTLARLRSHWEHQHTRLMIRGARGLGKACIAKAFAHQFLEEDQHKPADQRTFNAYLWWSGRYQPCTLEKFLEFLESSLRHTLQLDYSPENLEARVRNLIQHIPCLIVVTKVTVKHHQAIIDFLSSLPSTACIVLTSPAPITGWITVRIQKLTQAESLLLVDTYAQENECEYLLNATRDSVEKLCLLCGGSPVALKLALDMIAKGTEFESILKKLDTAIDGFRVLCTDAYEQLSPLAQDVFRAICMSEEHIGVHALMSGVQVEQDALQELIQEIFDLGLIVDTSELESARRRYSPAYRLIREHYVHVIAHHTAGRDAEIKRRIFEYYHQGCLQFGYENWAGHDWIELNHTEIFAMLDELMAGSDPHAQKAFLELIESLYYFMGVRGHWHQKKEYGIAAAEIARQTGDERKAAMAWVRIVGWTEIQFEQFAEAEAHVRSGLEIYQRLNDPGGQASALRYLGSIRRRQEQIDEARTFYDQALETCRLLSAAEQDRLKAGIQVSYSTLYLKIGEYERAREQLENALEVFRRLKHSSKEAEVLSRLGNLELIAGNAGKAEAYFRESEQHATSVGRYKTRAYNLLGLAQIIRQKGNSEEARRLALEALNMFQKLEIANEAHEKQLLQSLTQ